jgi:hypothetical protein
VCHWRKIAIVLIDLQRGETKAQACDISWFRQLLTPRNRTGREGVQVSMSAIGTDKRLGRAFVSIAVAIIGVLTTTAGAQRRLQMEVKVAPPDPSRMIIGAPTTKTYVGLLRNAGKSPVLVQIIPISGRHKGNGRFGACYLERWDATSHRWVYLPAPVMSLESVPVYSSTLNGGDAIDVCGRPSAEELGQSGTRYRFTLQVQLKGSKSPSLLSRTFKVGLRRKAWQRDANRDTERTSRSSAQLSNG